MTTRRRDLTAQGAPLLFDLPLDDEQEPGEVLPDRRTAAVHIATTVQAEQEDLFASDEPSGETAAPAYGEPRSTPAEPELEEGPATVSSRLLAGAADLLIHGGVLAGVSLGLYSMSIEPRPWQWPGFLVLLLAFSFVYTVVSLSFWGQTAGMAWREMISRDRLARPLSFRQATLRWLGGLLTLGLCGLPALLAYRGSSLTDLLSSSVTLEQIVVDG